MSTGIAYIFSICLYSSVLYGYCLFHTLFDQSFSQRMFYIGLFVYHALVRRAVVVFFSTSVAFVDSILVRQVYTPNVWQPICFLLSCYPFLLFASNAC